MIVIFSFYLFLYNEIYRKKKKKVDKQTRSNFKGRGALVAFPKMHLSERQGEPLLFGTFNIVISYTFPENFIEIPQVIQKI